MWVFTRDNVPLWVFICSVIAYKIFMMQHTLFVFQYVRAAITLPLFFCQQTPQVVRKRNCYVSFIGGIEIATAVIMVGSAVFQIIDGYGIAAV